MSDICGPNRCRHDLRRSGVRGSGKQRTGDLVPVGPGVPGLGARGTLIALSGFAAGQATLFPARSCGPVGRIRDPWWNMSAGRLLATTEVIRASGYSGCGRGSNRSKFTAAQLPVRTGTARWMCEEVCG